MAHSSTKGGTDVQQRQRHLEVLLCRWSDSCMRGIRPSHICCMIKGRAHGFACAYRSEENVTSHKETTANKYT